MPKRIGGDKHRESRTLAQAFGAALTRASIRTGASRSWPTRSATPSATDDPQQIAEKRRRFAESEREAQRWNWRQAANAYVAAFLVPKTKKEAPSLGTATIPTTEDVFHLIAGDSVIYGPRIGRIQQLVCEALPFHWPLEFPDIMERGGFDVVLGNPPWEVMQLSEEEYFALRASQLDMALVPSRAAGFLRISSSRQTIRPMMDEQRALQRSCPPEARVYIGGEIQIHHLMPTSFNVYRLHRFDDFEADARMMFARSRMDTSVLVWSRSHARLPVQLLIVCGSCAALSGLAASDRLRRELLL